MGARNNYSCCRLDVADGDVWCFDCHWGQVFCVYRVMVVNFKIHHHGKTEL